MRKTLFISDLHLDETKEEMTEKFLFFLHHLDASTDALYILGDLFEIWIGDDYESPMHLRVKNALKAVTQKGLPIYFLAGNRDFLIGKRFLSESGCSLIQDETPLTLYGTAVLLMHGDTLCTADLAYLKSRKLARNAFLQWLFLLLPLKIRLGFADKMRALSKRHTEATPLTIMDVTEEAVVNIMSKYQVQCLIHGHTHRPAFHSLTANAKPAVRIVLDAWHGHGNMLLWNELGEKKLINF
jgi:UDP-2,3-diacylglucosamine hydrolase